MPLVNIPIVKGHREKDMVDLQQVIHETIVEGGDADWTFGFGEAQFFTDDL